MSYVTGFPPDGSSLGNTKVQIRTNLDSTFNTLAINHLNNNDASAGKHQYIQLPSRTHPGSTALGELLLFNGALPNLGAYNLCFNGSNTVVGGSSSVQMTRSEIPSQVTNGYSWIAGNILIQWGTAALTVNHNIAVGWNTTFANVFSVVGIGVAGGSSPTNNVWINSFSPAGFSLNCTSSSLTQFNWIAIGN